MFTVEYANGDIHRRHDGPRRDGLYCEVIEHPVSGPPRVVCLASHDDAVCIAELLNMSERLVPRHDDVDEVRDPGGDTGSSYEAGPRS